jgi:hypothetical protein
LGFTDYLNIHRGLGHERMSVPEIHLWREDRVA